MKITIQELSKSFGGRDIFNNFSLEVDSGVRLCVCGPNGTGKSTLLRLLAGVEPADGGRVILPRGCRLGFVEQELSEEALDTPLLTYVLDVLHDWNEFWAEWEEAAQQKDEARLTQLMHRQAELEATHGYNPEHRAKAVLSGLGFAESKWLRTLRELSGGWRERAKLARVLTAGADVLLLDEPTNHLDLESREALGTALQKFDGTLLMVAHDRWLLSQVGAEAWALDEKGITVYPDFASYDTARRAALESGSVSPSLNASNKAEKPDNAPRANLSREEQKRLKREQAERRNALHKELKPLQQKYAALEAAGLTDPIGTQLLHFYNDLLHLDFGTSRRIQNGATVVKVIGKKFGVSMRLGLTASAISLVVGVLMGILQAAFKDKVFDWIGTAYTVFVNAVPSLVSYSLVLVFGSKYLGFPTLYSTRNVSASSVLPITCLSLASIAGYALWTRRYMVDELTRDYIKLARVKGLSSSEIMFKHVLRNAMVPMVQYIPQSILLTVGGSLLMERFFSVPGMGPLLTDAIQRYDLNVVQTLVILYAVLGIVGVFMGDVLMMLVDPRITLTGKEAAR